MESIDCMNQSACCVKPDGTATVQVGGGKIEAIGGELHLSGNLDLIKLVTEKCS